MNAQAIPTEVLNFGGIGLGLYFLYLAYTFFTREQRREGEPRKILINGVVAFMITGAILSMFFGYLEIFEKEKEPDIKPGPIIKTVAQEYAIFKHSASNGTESGPMKAKIWTERKIGIGEYSDGEEWATNDNNNLKLTKGTYIIRAIAPGFAIGRHKIRLRNLRTGDVILGMNAYSKEKDFDVLKINGYHFKDLRTISAPGLAEQRGVDQLLDARSLEQCYQGLRGWYISEDGAKVALSEAISDFEERVKQEIEKLQDQLS